mmetsp:Transcript_5458/g.13735  ORF Transcript_5458/g.13735 Transcript_5458/m.13735 type:complete len:203 (-) Transcript_5458:813-1421(-)
MAGDGSGMNDPASSSGKGGANSCSTACQSVPEKAGAARTSSAKGRECGSFSSRASRVTANDSSSGKVGASFKMEAMSCRGVSAWNGVLPVASSPTRIPKAHQSTATPYAWPLSISGAIYSTEPQKDRHPCKGSFPSAASPKSATTQWPWSSMRTFDGLQSRWTTPFACRNVRATTNSANAATQESRDTCLLFNKVSRDPREK